MPLFLQQPFPFRPSSPSGLPLAPYPLLLDVARARGCLPLVKPPPVRREASEVIPSAAEDPTTRVLFHSKSLTALNGQVNELALSWQASGLSEYK